VLKSLFFAARSLDPHEIRTREKWVGRWSPWKIGRCGSSVRWIHRSRSQSLQLVANSTDLADVATWRPWEVVGVWLWWADPEHIVGTLW
jgi:hypothetical protein